jgi:hypothetical protein
MAKKIIVKDIVIGDPICHPWYMFCNEYNEWDLIKDDVIFTKERFLPRILVNIGVVNSTSEVRRNRPELVKTLDKPDFIEVKWGKSKVYILIGE